MLFSYQVGNYMTQNYSLIWRKDFHKLFKGSGNGETNQVSKFGITYVPILASIDFEFTITRNNYVKYHSKISLLWYIRQVVDNQSTI